jgi:hypothetical protein
VPITGTEPGDGFESILRQSRQFLPESIGEWLPAVWPEEAPRLSTRDVSQDDLFSRRQAARWMTLGGAHGLGSCQIAKKIMIGHAANPGNLTPGILGELQGNADISRGRNSGGGIK